MDQATETNKIRQYPFPEIESKWQRIWDEEQTFRTPDAVDTSKPKYYVLDMFPYPRLVLFQTVCDEYNRVNYVV